MYFTFLPTGIMYKSKEASRSKIQNKQLHAVMTCPNLIAILPAYCTWKRVGVKWHPGKEVRDYTHGRNDLYFSPIYIEAFYETPLGTLYLICRSPYMQLWGSPNIHGSSRYEMWISTIIHGDPHSFITISTIICGYPQLDLWISPQMHLWRSTNLDNYGYPFVWVSLFILVNTMHM